MPTLPGYLHLQWSRRCLPNHRPTWV